MNRTGEPIRVIVCGCCGRMGSQVARAIYSEDLIQLVGGVDIKEVGRDLGEVIGVGTKGIPIFPAVAQAIESSHPHVMVDFTHPSVVAENVKEAIRLKVSTVVGTTGWTDEKIAEVDALAKEMDVPAFIAPNFSIGAVLMMRFAAEASRYFDRVEIIEMHHDGKADAPSGTALRTADLIRKSRKRDFPPPKVITPEVLVDGVLGGEVAGVRIHSVRLPGLLAHQEVLLGSAGQILTIRHDTLSREAFVPGVLLAIEKVRTLPAGVTVGLENLL